MLTLRFSKVKLNQFNSTANPNYTADELVYQLDTTKSKLLICHPDVVDIALAAGRQAGIAADHIILMQKLSRKSPIPFPTIEELVADGLTRPKLFTERTLSPGEGKTKLAFLCFSSGTTGKPKVTKSFENFVTIINLFLRLLRYRTMQLWRTSFRWHSSIK